MGLVQYTNLEDGNPASANDINKRFGDVLAQVNGNLDATNIKNGSLTRELFSTDALLAAWPVGSVYISVNDVNPGTLLGGSWVEFAKGRTIVGMDAEQTEFNELEKVGGSKEETLSVNQMPVHNHTGITGSAGNHSHNLGADYLRTSPSGGNRVNNSIASGQQVQWGSTSTSSAGSHTHSFTTANRGGGQAHNNLQPYIVVKLWQRVA